VQEAVMRRYDELASSMDEVVSVHDVFVFVSQLDHNTCTACSLPSFPLVKRGGKVLVLAPFDAGKSTLARILAGLCPNIFPVR
jgi:ABC-type uncharacterized transport system fused permease/ATPase subunit